MTRSPNDKLAKVFFASLRIGFRKLGRGRSTLIDQELLVFVVTPPEDFSIPCHSKALLVACVDLANLLVFQRLDLCRTVLNRDSLVFVGSMLAPIAVQLVNFDLTSLAEAELAVVVSAPRVNLSASI